MERHLSAECERSVVTSETVLVPGGRDVRATLDSVDADDAVVACPPHPQYGGTRNDPRLRAVSDALGERGVDCLRFDYGEWDRGRGERTDALAAVRWARERYDRVGLFGYSFGAGVALVAAAEIGSTPEGDGAAAGDRSPLAAVSVLAPPARLTEHLDAAAAVEALRIPVQVVYGTRDQTVEWEPIVERARERGDDVVELSADHFFVGKGPSIGDVVAEFFVRNRE
ncbi:MAG: alpha/beta hydrolase [Salinigranum sp.]